MSRIYFHSQHGDAEVTGAERAHMGILVDPKHESLRDDAAFGRLLTEACQRGDDWRFVARIHGQCEIHAYVEGEDRDWLAGQIENALRTGLLRDIVPPAEENEYRPAWDTGWRKVIDLLRSRDDGPVVTSYSVCEGFPNLTLVRQEETWQPTKPSWEPEEEWYDLPSEEQWSTALAALRKKEERGSWLRLQPANWATWFSS